VLEGGAIHTDGNGTLMLTEDVIFDTGRNPGLDKKEAEYILEKYLGVENFIWLIAALEFDDTGGHVDNLACFTPNNQIITLTESNPNDSNYDRLKENHDRLKHSKDIDGKSFEIISIQQPSHRSFLNERMPLSYVNFYMVNHGIILPIFNDPMDTLAIDTITSLFKNKKVVTLEGSRIVEGGGCVHCITQQQPDI
jgi:agmatine deiminase